MAVTVVDLARGVTGAVRLALGDPRGLGFFDATRDGAVKSFAAAVLVLPGYVVIRLVEQPALLGAPLWPTVPFEALAYVVVWTVFPAAMTWVAPAIGRADRLYVTIAAYNWASVVALTLWLPFVLLMASGAAEEWLQPLGLVLTGAALLYGWFVLRTALSVPGWLAAALVAGDYVASATLGAWSDGLLASALG